MNDFSTSESQPQPAGEVTVILHTAPPPGARGAGGALTKIDGRESVLRTMEMFTNRPGVTQTLLAIDPAQAELYKQKCGSHLMFMGVKLVQAGPTWIEQLRAAQAKLGEASHVLLHDAARPAVPFTDLDAMLGLIGRHPIVGLAAPIAGPLVRASVVPGGGTVESRNDLAALLSPVLYTRAAFDEVCAAGKPAEAMQLIEGSPLNVRVTEGNASLVKAMLGLLPKPKVRGPLNPFEEAQW
ncbi:MAG: 2-C-methyl-D-erythritol 4-phosphate cytidylyltransferase [Tepidisphaeraceae bacterium]